jgi:Inhibitor of growth proteins N-terminal histone-binding
MVYSYGEFTGLLDVSAVLARTIPRCPDCQGVVRQFTTQRFNRVINRAVIDEMSKRFLVNGKTELQSIEQQVGELDRSLEDTRKDIIQSIDQAAAHSTKQLTLSKQLEISQKLKDRNQQCRKLEQAIKDFRNKVADKHQPAQKLHEATIHAARSGSIDQPMAGLSLGNAVPAVERDRRVTLGGRAAQLKAESISLTDRFSIVQALKSLLSSASVKIAGGAPDQLAKPFFQSCKSFITDCEVESLPKLGVEACLHYASVAQSYRSFGSATATNGAKTSEYIKTAQELLERARGLCDKKFQNAELLREAIEASIKRLEMEWYEEVTPDELAAIKAAMVGGPGGIATHSGHWYNCQNGHPVSSLKLSSSYNSYLSYSISFVSCVGWRVVFVCVPTRTPFCDPEGLSCTPLSLPPIGLGQIQTQALLFYPWHLAPLLTLRTVCNRRVRNADGTSTLPGMRSTHWRAGSSGS